MLKEQSLQADNFFSKGMDLGCEGVILRAEHFDLGLQVLQPLLFSLPAFEGSNSGCRQLELIKSNQDLGILPISF